MTGRVQTISGAVALAAFMAAALIFREVPPPRPWLAFTPGNYYTWAAVDSNRVTVASGTWGKKAKKQRYERRTWTVLGDDGLVYQVEEITNPQ